MITNEKPQAPETRKTERERNSTKGCPNKVREKNKAQTLKNIYFCVSLIYSPHRLITNEKPQAPETRKTERERNSTKGCPNKVREKNKAQRQESETKIYYFP